MSETAFPVLLADIGGTNARFRVLESGAGDARVFDTVPVADYATIEDAILSVVIAQMDEPPARAVIAAAGPIRVDGMDFTNSAWEVRPKAFLARTGIATLQLVNDFEAQALALPVLDGDDIEAIGPHFAPRNDRTKAVIGPGTGLGVGTLVHAGNLWVPVPGEGGHVDLGPRSEREEAIWTHLERAEGRVSGEQILSGDGLVNLYNAVCAADGREAMLHGASAVSTAALSARERGEDSEARATLDLFCILLGRVAGDLALTTFAQGGVYLAGGITARILPFLRDGGFRDAFEDKAPHRALMADIATFAITAPLPALEGLEALARNAATYRVDLERRTWTSADAG